MIRKVISCDICGAQKRDTNHWFIAYEDSGELRVSDWTSHHLLCPGTKHLCGESCVHKLVGEYLAESTQARTPDAAVLAAPQSEVASVPGSVPTEPRHALGLRTQIASTSFRSNQNAMEGRHNCVGRRTS